MTGTPDHRCRLCTANDVDGLIERLAEELWDSRRYGTLDDRPWAQAGEYWQRTFRELTETVVASLQDHTALNMQA